MVESNNRNPLLVILEGPECTGKTTIAAKLIEEFGAKGQKGVRIADRFLLMSSTMRDIENQILRTSGLVGEAMTVFDRWAAISDCVYERYLCSGSPVTEQMLPFFRDIFARCNVQVLFLRISKDEMVSRFNSRGDNIVSVEEACRVYDGYETFYGDHIQDVNGQVVDLDGLSEDECYEKIKHCLRLDSQEV